MQYTITKDYLPPSTKRRPAVGVNPSVRFLVAHDTGNPDSTARGNVHYYQSTANAESASAHIFVDDKEIIECVPALTGPPEKAWHVRYGQPHDNHLFGLDANDAAVGVEYCYGKRIDADEAYRRYVWTLATLASKFGLNPTTHIVGHYFLDPERRTDPITGLARSRRTFEQLLRDVTSELAELRATGSQPVASPLLSTLFTVGQSVVAKSAVRVRTGIPNTLSPISKVIKAGEMIKITSLDLNGEPISGNSLWLVIANNSFVWSGAFI